MESFLKYTRRSGFLLVILTLFSSLYGMTNVQKAYVNENFIGYVDDKVQVKDIYKEVLENINDSFSEVDKGWNSLKFEQVSDSNQIKLTNNKELKRNIVDALNIDVAVYAMLIDDINVGYIDNFKTGDEVISTLKNKAVVGNNLNKGDIVALDIKGNVSYNKEKVKIADITSPDKIINNIEKINNTRSDKIANIEVLEIKKEIETISQGTKEIETENLCLGEIKKEEGHIGSREVKRKNTYVDGKLVDSVVLDEVILEKPKEDIIYKGMKNPIETGTVFLNYPSDNRQITSPYGTRWGNEHHSGIDLGGKIGDPIIASFEGVVKYAGWKGGYGNVVILSHGSGVETLYAHASKVTCSTGQRVSKGDKIAEVGSTGRSTGPHIHFELRNNGKAINPISYMKA